MKKASAVGIGLLVLGAVTGIKAESRDTRWIVTSSNAAANELLVYDTAGAFVQAVSTNGQGGVGGNAGGVATNNGAVAVVNFGSQSVSVFVRGAEGLTLRQVVPVASPPVSVAYGTDHLYVLGTTTVESHRIDGPSVDVNADGLVALRRGDGSAAQVGVVADQLIISEKSGAIELTNLRGGAVASEPVLVDIPAAQNDTPFGLVTRGTKGFVTIAHSDAISLIENGQLIAQAATGSDFPDGPGEHAPCWIALIGPYLFTSNSPSHSISRLVTTGRHIALDDPIAARTNGAPIDIAATEDGLLAVIEDNGNGQSHLTQFRIDADGGLVQTSTVAIAAAANGIAIVPNR